MLDKSLILPRLQSPPSQRKVNILATQRAIRGIAAQAEPGIFSERYDLGPHPRPVESASAF